MEKDTKYIIAGIIIIVLILSSFWYYSFIYKYVPYTPPKQYTIVRLNQTKVDNDYIVTVIVCIPSKIDPKGLKWGILNLEDTRIFYNDLPKISGEKGSTSHKNVTVTWFDNDNNGKLSEKDSFQIKSINYDLNGHTFRIFELIDDYYAWMANIELE